MGVFQALTKIDGSSSASIHHYGGHSLQTGSILDAVSDSINPTTNIEWTVKNPEVLKTPKTVSLAEADKAEREVGDYEHAVSNARRLFNAEARRQEAFAKLVGSHRQYLGRTATAHKTATQANAKLGKHLHGMRDEYAEMGFGLDRKNVTATQRVDTVASKYKG
jgi:hypothetical protein